ncbi:hypothetical protein IHN32_06235, partial [Deinococcus sp. 14RED07]|nr:hypothetical protein [Deinococcus sp. 14RED07]
AGLAGGNLLCVAALLPAALRGAESLPTGLRSLLLGLSAFLLVLAVVAILSFPSRRGHL